MGAGPRTSYRRVDLRAVDVVAALAGLLAAIAGTWAALVLGQGSPTTSLIVPPPVAVAIVGAAAIVFVVVVGRALAALGGR